MIEHVVLPECPEIEREDSMDGQLVALAELALVQITSIVNIALKLNELIDHINQYETPGKN
jgi:hypothetical protein